jgi:hypothetical protein
VPVQGRPLPYGVYRASVPVQGCKLRYGFYIASVSVQGCTLPYGLYRASVPVQGCNLPYGLCRASVPVQVCTIPLPLILNPDVPSVSLNSALTLLLKFSCIIHMNMAATFGYKFLRISFFFLTFIVECVLKEMVICILNMEQQYGVTERHTKTTSSKITRTEIKESYDKSRLTK